MSAQAAVVPLFQSWAKQFLLVSLLCGIIPVPFAQVSVQITVSWVFLQSVCIPLSPFCFYLLRKYLGLPTGGGAVAVQSLCFITLISHLGVGVGHAMHFADMGSSDVPQSLWNAFVDPSTALNKEVQYAFRQDRSASTASLLYRYIQSYKLASLQVCNAPDGRSKTGCMVSKPTRLLVVARRTIIRCQCTSLALSDAMCSTLEMFGQLNHMQAPSSYLCSFIINVYRLKLVDLSLPRASHTSLAYSHMPTACSSAKNLLHVS